MMCQPCPMCGESCCHTEGWTVTGGCICLGCGEVFTTPVFDPVALGVPPC